MAAERSNSYILGFPLCSPAAGISDVTGVGVHGYGVHGEVRNQQRLPVFEAATTANLLGYSQQCYTEQDDMMVTYNNAEPQPNPAQPKKYTSQMESTDSWLQEIIRSWFLPRETITSICGQTLAPHYTKQTLNYDEMLFAGSCSHGDQKYNQESS